MVGSPRITIRDVARRAGVSIGTVSNTLNQSPGVGPDARSRVLAAAAELGYRVNRAAQATRTGRTRTLAFVTPDLRNPFYPQLARAIAQAARAAGYAILLVDTEDGQAERECIEQVLGYGVDGILWCPATETDVIADLPISTPVIAIDCWLPGRDNISANYRMSGKLIADLVIRHGYRSIGLISGPLDIPAARLRRDHLLAFLRERVPIAWEVFHPFDMTMNAEATSAIQEGSADVVICCDDMMALGALQIAREAGLSVPRDLAVIGHDDLPISAVMRPGLTTIRQPLDALGREAVAMVLGNIEEPGRAFRDVAIDVQLIERETTRRSSDVRKPD